MSDGITCNEAPAREGQITTEMNSLDQRIVDLGSIADKFDEKLSTILSEESSSTGDPKKVEGPPAMCGFANNLHCRNQQLNAIINRLLSVLERVEL